MNCVTEIKLDDYLDGRLSDAEAEEVTAHAAACPACRARLAFDIRLRERLHRLPVPEPDLGVFERALARVQEEETARRRRGAVWAIAASVVIAVAVTAYLPHRSEPGIPGVNIALHQVQEISLTVDSPRRLENATFRVALPEGIELAGYPGRREITWTGNLEAGHNLLVLPIKAEAGKGGDIVTSVSHVDRTKTFVLNLSVTPGSDSGPAATEETHNRVVM